MGKYKVEIIFNSEEEYIKDFEPKIYNNYEEAYNKILNISRSSFISANGFNFIPISNIKQIKIIEYISV